MSDAAQRRPSWQLPPGVTRGMWEYAQTEHIARDYDEYFAFNSLFEFDQEVLNRHFTRPGYVIDLGCGTGRALVPLMRRGFRGLAVDLSAEMLAVVGEKAEVEQLPIDRVVANLVDLDCLADGVADYCISMFSTLGMIRGRQNRQQALEHVRRVLKPGGLFVLHVHNLWYNLYDPGGPWWLLKNLLRASVVRDLEAGDKFFDYRQIPNMFLHVFRRRELLGALRQSGFRAREIIPLDPRRHQALSRPWLFADLRERLDRGLRMTTDPEIAIDSARESAPDFRPTASWQNLRLRADLLRKLRQFFFDRGFLEVETPLASADVVVDRHLDPLSVVLPDDPRQPNVGRRLWLQTSPEFAMKRLLASGAPAIYQIAKAFRADEIGSLHNPEFTIVEWYRPGDDMAAGMKFLSDLCEALLGRGPAQRLTYADAFQQHVGLDPHRASLADLRTAAAALDLSAPASLGDDRDGWLDLLLTERIQPHLGINQPAIVFDFPASQAALARIRAGDPAVGERFELYVDGVELANGYHELLDPAELRRRQTEANAHRRADGRAELPEESRLLAAMDAGLPSSTGVALGFDRLVMIAAGACHIREVMAFPIDRA